MKLKLLGALLCLNVAAMGQATVKYQFDGLGTTPVNGAAMWFLNTTPAATGLQQISPSLVFEGQGWKTTATAASQSVKFMQDVLPVQGTTSPSGIWRLRSSIDNGAYSATPIIQAFSDGTTTFASTVTIVGNRLLNFVGGTAEIRNSTTATPIVFSATYTTGTNANGAFQFRNISNSYIATSGTLSEVGISGSSYAPTSGTAAFNSFVLNNTVNQTGGANGQITWINATPTITAAVNVTGYDWNPTTPSNISGTHLAWRNTSGNVLIGGTSLTSGSVLVDMQSTTRGLLLPRVTNIASVTTPVNGMLAYDAATNLFNFRQNGAWVNLGGGTPGGSSGNIQYNNGGVFGGFGDYNAASGRLTITGSLRSSASTGNFSFEALGGSTSFNRVVNWYTGSVTSGGSVSTSVNIFRDQDAGVDLQDKSAIVQYNVLLTRADGSDCYVNQTIVVYRKDGTAGAVQVATFPGITAGTASPAPDIDFVIVGGTPQVDIDGNFSGDWKVKIWANVSISN